MSNQAHTHTQYAHAQISRSTQWTYWKTHYQCSTNPTILEFVCFKSTEKLQKRMNLGLEDTFMLISS